MRDISSLCLHPTHVMTERELNVIREEVCSFYCEGSLSWKLERGFRSNTTKDFILFLQNISPNPNSANERKIILNLI